MRHRYNDNELKNAVKTSLSIAGVCRELGIKPSGGNYRTLNIRIEKFDIDISHFTGQGWNTGSRYKPFGNKRELSVILVKNSPHIGTSSLKRRLLNEGIKINKCEECGIDEWNGKKITCELDHVNGDSRDNRIKNLKMLCPNCHSQTPTFRRRKKKKL